jgi:hypothetical protein
MTDHSLPSTLNVIRTLILLNEAITVDELIAQLAALGINPPTRFAVGMHRRSFLDVLKLLRGFDLLKDKRPPVPLWLKQHRNSQRQEVSKFFDTSSVPKRGKSKPFKPWNFPG